MAYFAEIQKNLVTQVIVISDSDCAGGKFPASESVGQKFIASLGIDGEWLQTSIENEYRGLYAGIGYTYDPDLDEFIAPIQIEETP
jgi:predicted transcriptional regulator